MYLAAATEHHAGRTRPRSLDRELSHRAGVYGPGASYERVEKVLGNASWVITGIVIDAIVGLVVRHRLRRTSPEEDVTIASTASSGSATD